MRRWCWLTVLMLVGVVGLSVRPALAAVTFTRTRVVVRGQGAVANIQLRPFRIAVGTASGRPVLMEVGNRNPIPRLLPPTADPLAPGTEPDASGQLYAPLSFLVGQYALNQYEGSIWGGDLKSGLLSGNQYSARSVIGARRFGAGAQLTVSTDDPSGRKLLVVVTPAGRGLIRVSARADPATAVAVMSDSFSSSPGEAFYGFARSWHKRLQH